MAYSKIVTDIQAADPKDFLEVMLSNSNNMIFVKDERFRILYANRAFLNMYSPEQRDSIIGTTTIESFTEEEAAVFLREDQKAFEQGSAELIEELADYKGVKRMYQTHKIRYTDKRGRMLMLGICNDITHWSEREKALAQSNLALENFAAVAAHDLRSPIGSILSAIEFITMDKENSLTKRSMDILSMIQKSAEGLVTQVANILSTYKTGTSSQLELTDVDVSVILEEIKFNIGNEIKRHDVTIRSSALPVIRSDRHFFRQVLHNLIENSIKYRSSEKPIIIIRYEKLGKEHVFSIEDNGLGLGEKGIGGIFKLFEQQDADQKGLGIGLSLCKKIVELHGGAIWVDQSYFSGCKISFAIPE